MGAGCSTKNATKVQDSVKQVNDVNELSQEAQNHLKMLQAAHPEGFSSTFDQEKLKNLGKDLRENMDAKDLDPSHDPTEPRVKHQELWVAAELNDTEKVTSYLDTYEEKSGEELKEQELYDFTGNSVIHKAASLGHAEILMLLLERTGAKPDLVNSSLATPLHLACKNDRVDAAKFLIGCGVDANQQDEHGQMPLLICCIHGHYELARMLIEASTSGHLPEPLEIDTKDHRGLSALNCAAIKGDFDMTKLLLINGGANVDGSSPKGCTPLLYAARGGYAEVVRFLLLKKASPLRQDNAGGTVLHHAIEKGHIEVLSVLQEHGIDVHSAIEIPDNAGRTAIFEAIDNHETCDILKLITKSRKDGGFEAKVNILNYNGQTPLFSAAREGNIEMIKCLVEDCDAKVDYTQGELYKEEYDEMEQQYQSLEEKFFMDAYKNCATPLHVAVVLGYEEIMLYLIEKGANPNLQTKMKGYSCLHLAVLANKPEIIIELLTKTQANPYLPDFGGRTLQDMIEIFIPSYLDSFKTLLENLQSLKQKGIDETVGESQGESLAGLAKKTVDNEGAPTVATHYYNPDDEREIQGLGADKRDIYNEKQDGEENKEEQADGGEKKSMLKQFQDIDESEIALEPGCIPDLQIENEFGRKVAVALIAQEWKYKEIALKMIYKQAEKYLDLQNKVDQTRSLETMTRACTSAVAQTCREKVIKVFSISLQLLNLMIGSTKIEKLGGSIVMKDTIVEKNIVLKLLQKSEEGNTRITNKIHETLLDLSFNPEIGEALTSSFILQRIQAHNRANAQKLAQKKTNTEEQTEERNEKIETEASLGSFKGLLAQLALLYKFINSFGIASKTRGPLSVKDILKSIVPTLIHQNQDVRNASNKILIDVQKLSGCVTEEDLINIPEKQKATLMEKIKKVKVEKNLEESNSRAAANRVNISAIQEAVNEGEDGEQTDRAEVPETISTNSPNKIENRKHQLLDLKALVEDKGQSKDWQIRELAFNAICDIYKERPIKQQFEKKDLLEDKFLQTCLILLKTGLEENNMATYLKAVETTSIFFAQALSSDTVHGSLQSMVTPIILRTTDTNTRIRKKSVDLIYQIWDYVPEQKKDKLKLNQFRDSQDEGQAKHDSFCQIIALVLCDSQHGEKAIVGRLGLFIKRAQKIDGSKDLMNKPLQMIIGKNYEQLTEFACQWMTHKNTKVRQNAMKLVVEVCRINCMDPRGLPFKQRILNYILGLRSQQREPLVGKINEACLKEIVANTSPGRAGQLDAYINVNEMDLNMASSKIRPASMDHMNAKRRMRAGSSKSKRGDDGKVVMGGIANSNSTAMLPSIGNAAKPPGGAGVGQATPTIVLPHSEPLTKEQKAEHYNLIEFFGLPIITCTLSKNWATRLAAIEKVDEQLHNLDPNRRDAMSAEINRQNMPVQVNFRTFLDFIKEGLKDPVLKNYLTLLELFQKALPTFFRYIQPAAIREELRDLIKDIIRKSSDLKQKIREASINFCLYLSHQSPVGPVYMVEQVLTECDLVLNNDPSLSQMDKKSSKTANAKEQKSQVATNFGNSHLISSCLHLLTQFQNQAKILSAESLMDEILMKFMDQINAALRHSNPQVRKEAEKLFKAIYVELGAQIEEKLVDQKPAIVKKLIGTAKQEMVSENTKAIGSLIKEAKKTEMTQEQKMEVNVQRAQDQIRDQVFNKSNLKDIIPDEHLQALKLPNPKKRQKAIIEIKKAISKKIVTQMTSDKARELFEPLTMLMRQLLQDESSEIYLEALSLLKFIVASLAPFLSTLDLHLMMGSFIGIIVQNTAVSANMRIQVSSDKVIVFFAKHQNIGPFVVAKEVNKNLEKLNKTILQAVGPKRIEVLNEKKQSLLRFYGILQLLLQQFSIVLCYQPEFYVKCLECLADSMIASSLKNQNNEIQEETAVKSSCTQIINNLYAIDYKLLDATVSKLDDINRKTPLRKVIIEYETAQKQGKNYIEAGIAEAQGLNKNNGQVDQMRDTQMSFASSTRQSLFSPGSHATRGQSPGGFGSSQYDGFGGSRFKNPSEASSLHMGTPNRGLGDSQTSFTATRRMMSLGEKRTPGTNHSENADYMANHPVSSVTQANWRRPKDPLPSLDAGRGNLNRTGVLLPQIQGGGLGSMPLKPPTYKFEAGGGMPPKPKDENVQLRDRANTFKVKSGGGAGFSSGPAPSDTPMYEPGSAQRRTPRRTLGNILNKNTMGSDGPNVPQSAGLAPTSFGSTGGMKDTLGSTVGSDTKGKPNKPPLYVPGARRTSENRMSVERRSGINAQGNGDTYVSKTGFSSLTVSSPKKSSSQAPYEDGKGIGASGFGGGYIPSAAQRK